MRKAILALVAFAAVGVAGFFSTGTSEAHYRGYYGRSYYSSWNYYNYSNYYYTSYYYTPSYDSYDYSYQYCIYYPSYPQYCYYYNPYSRVYWGRYDLKAKGYSLLAEKDRKGSLHEIAESAFPTPGAMPVVSGTKDNLKLAVPPAPPTK